MNSKRLKLRGTRFEAARKGASGTMDCSEATIRLDLRPDFCWPQFEVPRKERHNRRRSVGVERGENKILGGSDPTLSGFSAAQRLRAPGVATAQLDQQTSSLRRRQSCRRSSQQF